MSAVLRVMGLKLNGVELPFGLLQDRYGLLDME
jgi:hypothetical protein